MSVKDSLKKAMDEVLLRAKILRGQKGGLEKSYQNIKQSKPETKIGKVGRIAKMGSIDLTWFLFCLGKFAAKDLNTIFIDNKIIDKFTKRNKSKDVKLSDSQFKKFFSNLQKSYPRTAARLQLWVLYALFTGLVVGGFKVAGNIGEKKNKVSYEKVIKENEQNKENGTETYQAFLDRISPVTPWLIAELIGAEGIKVNEQGLHVPYKDSNGIWTIGFGSTVLKDGSKVTAKTPPITTEEAYELAKWHLEEKETFFILYCYAVADSNLLPRNTGEAFALASIVYNSGTKFIEDERDSNNKNRFTLLRKEYKKYGANISDKVIKEAFKKYPITKKQSFGKAWMDSRDSQEMVKAIGLYMKDGAGMHWRRWLEAGLITGDITPEDLLECPVCGFTDFYLYMGGYQEYKPARGESRKVKEKKQLELKKSSLWEKTAKGWMPKKSTYTAFKKWLKDPRTKQKRTGKEGVINRPKVKDFLPQTVQEQCKNGKCEIGVFHVNQAKNKVSAFNVGADKAKQKYTNNIYLQENNRIV